MMQIGHAGARWLHHQKNKTPFDDNRDGLCRSRGGVTRRLTPYGMMLFAAGLKRIDNGESVDRVANWARRRNSGATEIVNLERR